MAKLLRQIETDWYQEVSPKSYYSEGDLETAIFLNLRTLFPQFEPVVFNGIDMYDATRRLNKKADLALVSKDYKEWYVIEVELSKHSTNHVKSQIQAFHNCDYNDSHAEYIYNKRSDVFDLANLKRLVNSTPPKLMVIVNESKPIWKTKLARYGCIICVFQIFLNERDEPIYRLNGNYPYTSTRHTLCKLIKGLPFMIHVLDDDFLPTYGINNNDDFEISYSGKFSKWRRNDDGSKVFIECLGSEIPMDPSTSRYKVSYDDFTNKFTFYKA